MDLRFTPDEIAFRDEVREFFRTALPADIRRKTRARPAAVAEELVRWQRILHEKGWATPAWAPEWGGTGWSSGQAVHLQGRAAHGAGARAAVVQREHDRADADRVRHARNRSATSCRGSRSLEYWFCQGFSEPGAGSDLAALRTTAVRDGDHYVINGQKLWTSTAHHADWCFLLVRTDPQAKKQQGITYLLMDMRTPGITVRPIITLDGHHETNEMFLDNVRVPVANRLGEENKGWDYAKYLLGHERSGIARVGVSKMRVRRAGELAARVAVGGAHAADDPRFQERVAALEVELKALEITQMRVIAESGRTRHGKPDPKASILKLKGSELQQAATGCCSRSPVTTHSSSTATSCAACAKATTRPTGRDAIAPNHYWARHVSIVGGSNEIQRNILAKTVLGL